MRQAHAGENLKLKVTNNYSKTERWYSYGTIYYQRNYKWIFKL